MKKRIVISVTNDLTNDQRVHRTASTLVEAGYEVLLIGRKLRSSLPLKPRPYDTHRMRLLFSKGKFFYVEFTLRLLGKLLFSNPMNLLWANDLDTLLPNFWVSRFRKVPLVYDSHEYFTETPELIHRKRTRSVWLAIERFIFPKLNNVVTVNDSIAEIYAHKYGVKVNVVRNLPIRKDAQNLPLVSCQRILYQGALNVGRGVELMIDAMEFLPEMELHIAGKGSDEKNLRKYALEKNWQSRIIFHGMIPFSQLHELTQTACLGLSLEEDLGENYRLALPNKIFDYFQAGLPVIVSDLPEMKKIVENYKSGKILHAQHRTGLDLAEMIKGMVFEKGIWEKFHQQACLAAKELCWENEKQILLKIIRKTEGFEL